MKLSSSLPSAWFGLAADLAVGFWLGCCVVHCSCWLVEKKIYQQSDWIAPPQLFRKGAKQKTRWEY